jgi:hypothetical protein
MVLTLSCKLILIAILDILPRAVLNSTEESLNQRVLEPAESDRRTLCESEDPELRDKPRMEAKDAPVAGTLVNLMAATAPVSKVNELVNLELDK